VDNIKNRNKFYTPLYTGSVDTSKLQTVHWRLPKGGLHPKSSHIHIFLTLLLQLDNDQLMSEKQKTKKTKKNCGGTMLCCSVSIEALVM